MDTARKTNLAGLKTYEYLYFAGNEPKKNMNVCVIFFIYVWTSITGALILKSMHAG